MTIVVNGSGTITGISQGGLNDNIITQSELANTGVAGNGPAFSAYQSTGTSLTSGTYTKLLFDVEEFDTNGNFASSRFMPTVAGYYQLNAATAMSTTSAVLLFAFYKNGLVYKIAPNAPASGGGISSGVCGSTLIYLNGSTDFVEVYCNQSASTQLSQSGITYTWFNGALVRAA